MEKNYLCDLIGRKPHRARKTKDIQEGPMLNSQCTRVDKKKRRINLFATY